MKEFLLNIKHKERVKIPRCELKNLSSAVLRREMIRRMEVEIC